jgi:glycerol-3-phosphate O-acyltransferase/dihydroxyacetone phosphate acyltransferase
MLPKSLKFSSAEIVEIVSDTEARLKKEFGGESGKGTAQIVEYIHSKGVKGIEYKVVPHLDQSEMYASVYANLRDGGCIGIFPEGMYMTLYGAVNLASNTNHVHYLVSF